MQYFHYLHVLIFDETVVLAARQFVYVSQWFIIVAVVCHQKTK